LHARGPRGGGRGAGRLAPRGSHSRRGAPAPALARGIRRGAALLRRLARRGRPPALLSPQLPLLGPTRLSRPALPLDHLAGRDYDPPEFPRRTFQGPHPGLARRGGPNASVRSVSRRRVLPPPRRRRPGSALAMTAQCSPIPTPKEEPMATTTVAAATHVPWWKETTKDQWMAWWAA